MSLIGSLIALVIPHNLIGLIGFFLIAIAIKELIESRRQNHSDDNDYQEIAKWLSRNGWTAFLPFLMVAVLTFTGGEEIGVFTLIFATYNSLPDISPLSQLS